MTIRYDVRERVGFLTIDNPPVNAISQSVAKELIQLLDQHEPDDDVLAFVLTAEGRTFVAGADVREFEKRIDSGDTAEGAGLYEVTNRLESCSKPIIATLFGNTLGGGLELAMACHYRVAVPGSRLGQPEVNLGLIPGAGGTQRLPRLCGIVEAARLCGLGKPITAEKAKELGIVDELISGNLAEFSIQFALRTSNDDIRRTSELVDKNQLTPAIQEELIGIRDQVRQVHQGAPAGEWAIDAITRCAELPFEDGITLENELFAKSLSSPEAKSLIKLFFAERNSMKVDSANAKNDIPDVQGVRFPYLDEADVKLVELLLRNQIPVAIGDPPADGKDEIYFVRDTTRGLIKKLAESNTTVCLTASDFSTESLLSGGIQPDRVVGLQLSHTIRPFAEIGTTEKVDLACAIQLVQLMKRLKIPFVLEQPRPKYVSQRIQMHRHDQMDLKIEAWQLYQEKVVRSLGDIDIVNVNCFGQPRHLANLSQQFSDDNLEVGQE